MSMTRFAVIASLTALVGCAPSDGIRTDNAEARELYRQGGVFQARRAGRADADLAAARFQAAVEADTGFGQGWAALAQASMWLEFNQGVQGQRAIAEAALERAVALEPDAVETRLLVVLSAATDVDRLIVHELRRRLQCRHESARDIFDVHQGSPR